MSQDPKQKTTGRPNHGLRLISTPKEPTPEAKKSASPSSSDAARSNPLVKQLQALADAIDADIAMIMKF